MYNYWDDQDCHMNAYRLSQRSTKLQSLHATGNVELFATVQRTKKEREKVILGAQLRITEQEWKRMSFDEIRSAKARKETQDSRLL